MYIPIRSSKHPAVVSVGSQSSASVPIVQDPSAAAPLTQIPVIGRFGTLLEYLFGTPGDESHPALRKRQYNGDEAHDLNVTIGIIVGVLVAAFVIGVGVFLHFYGRSMRFSDKRNRQHRKSSGSSKSSSSSRSVPPPPPPPGAPPPPPP